ncbi:MAG TPA: hypothetical protein ENK98_03115 [Epsilonproteobacteria bacterium]|nr:hypothetical protein [Campylobacterota bacterium]
MFLTGYYIFSPITKDNWKVKRTIQSSDGHVFAKIKCLNNGGATVGFYCKLFLDNQDNNNEEIMMVRNKDIDINWVSNNVLAVYVNKYEKIYDFTSVYWDDKFKTEYFINIQYK